MTVIIKKLRSKGMYQLITLYGDNEPWWFFEDWQEDIKEKQTFSTLAEAEAAYREKWFQMYETFTFVNAKMNYLSAFWNDGEERWCEECDDYLQQYTGLALLKDNQPLAIENGREFYEATNSNGKTKRCKRPQ